VAHLSRTHVSTQAYGLLSAVAVVAGIVINYATRPDLFGSSLAYSLYGTMPETKYIFSSSLIIAGFLLLYESHYIGSRWRRRSCYLIALGFTIIALVPINNGYKTDMVHGIGTFFALVGLLISLGVGIRLRRTYVPRSKQIVYGLLFLIALSSAAISILSGGRFGVLELQGFAEYSGLAVYTAWVLLDFGDVFTA
jgi:hypothetical protein